MMLQANQNAQHDRRMQTVENILMKLAERQLENSPQMTSNIAGLTQLDELTPSKSLDLGRLRLGQVEHENTQEGEQTDHTPKKQKTDGHNSNNLITPNEGKQLTETVGGKPAEQNCEGGVVRPCLRSRSKPNVQPMITTMLNNKSSGDKPKTRQNLSKAKNQGQQRPEQDPIPEDPAKDKSEPPLDHIHSE
jgi:hypothetical protein